MRRPDTPPAPAPRTTSTYLRVAARVGAQRATLSVARKITRRCHHRLRAVGDQAFAELPNSIAA